ncbi:hypothetical protein AB0M86_19180 [Streptomyces sp. NPDC051639]|uniref:hypothetical protein n=1 Tax=Streptomyces sp. NPDC051639 TaxID=3155671 RepID=UPI00342EA90F
MQAEVISALIGAAVATPAAAAAYAVGRHQATASVKSAKTQVDGSHHMWRSENQRTTWLAFTEALDGVERVLGRPLDAIASWTEYGAEFIEAATCVENELRKIEFEGPGKIYTLAKQASGKQHALAIIRLQLGPYIAAQEKFDLAVAKARQAQTLGIGQSMDGTTLEAHTALAAARAEILRNGPVEPPAEIRQMTETAMAPFSINLDPTSQQIIQNFTQGLAIGLLSIFSSVPQSAVEAKRRLQECTYLSEKERMAILYLSASGVTPIFKRIMDSFNSACKTTRTNFVKEVNRCMGAKLTESDLPDIA